MRISACNRLVGTLRKEIIIYHEKNFIHTYPRKEIESRDRSRQDKLISYHYEETVYIFNNDCPLADRLQEGRF